MKIPKTAFLKGDSGRMHLNVDSVQVHWRRNEDFHKGYR